MPELANLRLMAAGACLDDRDRALQARPVANELEQDDVVGQVGDAVVGDARGSVQVGRLEGHHEADLLVGAALQQ
jgi:hypothetical protein